MKLEGKKIVFLGDSITEGVGASCVEKRFSDVLVRKAGFTVSYNHGISGTRMANHCLEPQASTCTYLSNC